MKLHELVNVLSSGVFVRVATENGEGWLMNERLIKLDIHSLYPTFAYREVTHIYFSEGRDASPQCCKLEEGFCIIVKGSENGFI